MSIWGVIVAAGAGSRLAGLGRPKQFLDHLGRPLYWHSVRRLAEHVAGLVLVFPANDLTQASAQASDLARLDGLTLPLLTTAGGSRRQDSVRQALDILPNEATAVLVHDAARPFADSALIRRLTEALAAGHKAVIPGLVPKDTIKIIAPDSGLVLGTPNRASLIRVQTPQAFDLPLLRQAHALALEKNLTVTDDAALVELLGQPVLVVEGQEDNIKITSPDDLAALHGRGQPVSGLGYDVHRFCAPTHPKARPLRLGGVLIADGGFVLAHSDGDVLLHALMDALLSCAGLGDIGRIFPDSDPALDNADSAELLARALDMCRQAGFSPTALDLTIITEIPKIAPWRDKIIVRVAELTGLDPSRVNCKATTEEGLGFTGERLGLKAVVLANGRLNI